LSWWRIVKTSQTPLVSTETPFYGCWIETNGAVQVCSNQQMHYSIAREEFDLPEGTEDTVVYDKALHAGWIRIAVKSVEFMIPPTQLQVQAVLKWFIPVRASQDFYVECPTYNGRCNLQQMRQILMGQLNNLAIASRKPINL
jgi:hypothetical protein